jgi:sensor domain CHASE-containing protein
VPGLDHANHGWRGVRVPDYVFFPDEETQHAAAVVQKTEDLRASAAYAQHALAEVREEIAATDEVIDQIVYQLYGLTEEEIALVSCSDVVEGEEG